MFSLFKFATATLFATLLALGTASPLVERATCRPNFEGNRLTIYHTSPLYRTVNEWTSSPTWGSSITLQSQPAPPALERGEFLVPFSGEPSGTYQFK
jgi:hypothetical protein